MMKRTIAFLASLFTVFQFVSAQTSLDINVSVESACDGLSKGKAIVTGVRYDFESLYPSDSEKEKAKVAGSYYIDFEQKDKVITVLCSEAPKRFAITSLDDSIQSFWDVQTIASLPSLSRLSDLYGIRSAQEEDVMNYVSNLEKLGYTFDDPYLLSYLYSLLLKVFPNRKLDGFPYSMNIVIANDDSMNAYVFPNGTMIINTGLLANVHTEDELVAIMAHEIGHFAANHSLVNIQKQEQRANRAEAWAALATVLAAGTEVYMGSQGYYTGGAFTATTAVLSSAIVDSAMSQIGIEYSRTQESDADDMAVAALGLLGYDTNALSTVLSRMAELYNEEGNWAAYYLSGDHPSLNERIAKHGQPDLRRDHEFEKKVSFAVTNMAVSKYNLGRFAQALKYVDQNIEIGVATDDDYLIKANCLMNLRNDKSSMSEALALIRKAKTINSENINILKAEILAAIRLEQFADAHQLILEYQDRLQDSMSLVEFGSPVYNSLSDEFDWSRRMGVKLAGWQKS